MTIPTGGTDMKPARPFEPSGKDRAAAEIEGADAFRCGLDQTDNPWPMQFNPFILADETIKPADVYIALYKQNLSICWRRGFSHAEESDLKRATEQAHPFQDDDPDGWH